MALNALQFAIQSPDQREIPGRSAFLQVGERREVDDQLFGCIGQKILPELSNQWVRLGTLMHRVLFHPRDQRLRQDVPKSGWLPVGELAIILVQPDLDPARYRLATKHQWREPG